MANLAAYLSDLEAGTPLELAALRQQLAARQSTLAWPEPGQWHELKHAETCTFIEQAVLASQQLYHLQQPKHAAAVWWFSWCNTIWHATAVQLFERSQVLEITAQDHLVVKNPQLAGDPNDTYWLKRIPARMHPFVQADEFLTQDLPAQITGFWQLSTALVAHLSENFGLKKALVDAIAADAVSGAYTQSGCVADLPLAGAAIALAARRLLHETRQAPLLTLGVADREQDYLCTWLPDDGTADPLASLGKDMDVLLIGKRSSCCQIKHSPTSEICQNCPQLGQEALKKHVSKVALAIDSGWFD